MKRRYYLLSPSIALLFIILAVPLYGGVAHSIVSADLGSPIMKPAGSFEMLPLAFEPNLGQADPKVRFVGRGNGASFLFTSDSVIFRVSRRLSNPKPGEKSILSGSFVTDSVRLSLVGVSPGATISGGGLLPGKSNYIVGDDPSRWRKNVPMFSKIRYEGIYPGVDLIFYGNQRRLEYDFVVAPGVDPSIVRIKVEGAVKSSTDSSGNLVLSLHGIELLQKKPLVYQMVDGRKLPVDGHYVKQGAHIYGFVVGPYDRSRALVIDPVLQYSTYLGGTDSEGTLYGDKGHAIAVDGKRNAYITGTTTSNDFPIVNPIESPCTENCLASFMQAFVSKINTSGNFLEYSTFLGGLQSEGTGIAVDNEGNVWVTGNAAHGFPTVAPLMLYKGGGGRIAFVMKIDPTGTTPLFSTYLSGSTGSEAVGIAVDGDGNAYVAGDTGSNDFPVISAFQSTMPRYGGGFISKIKSDGTLLLYSTYLGGSGGEIGPGFYRDNVTAIAVDGSGHAYVTGSAVSNDFPLHNPLQGTLRGQQNAFVTKFTENGNGLEYSTYLGGTAGLNGQSAEGIAVDSDDAAYVVGTTTATDFPTVSPLQATNKGRQNAFVSKIKPDGSGLEYSTYIGGSGTWDQGAAIAVDASKQAYVAGTTDSPDFPIANAIQGAKGTGGPFFGNDAFVCKLSAAGNAFVYSTFLGGQCNDYALGIATDTLGAAYVTGDTCSMNFPLAFPIQDYLYGTYNVFVSKIADAEVLTIADLSLTMADAPDPVAVGQPLTYTITVTNDGPDPALNVMTLFPMPANTNFVSAGTSQGSCTSGAGVTCELGTLDEDASATLTIQVTPQQLGTLSAIALAWSDVTDPDTGNNEASTSTQVLNGNATTISVGSSLNPSEVGQPVMFSATVTPVFGGGVPTGTVQFQSDGVNLGASVSLIGGSASVTTSSLAAGTHPITA
ncbi:MAG: SBBP repeat-containing protein, partial [Thermodesulfovibrionales bacterium]